MGRPQPLEHRHTRTPCFHPAAADVRSWTNEDPIDLRDAEVSVYLRGDNLDLGDAQCYFWVVGNGGRWHLTSQPITISQNAWAAEPTRLKLDNDPSRWHNSWAGHTPNPKPLESVLGRVISYGFSFVGMRYEPAGRHVSGRVPVEASQRGLIVVLPRLTVGIISMSATPWALEDNFRRMEGYVREAARRRAEVVIAPESVIDGYVCAATADVTRERMLAVGETVPDGPYLRRAGDLCRELGIYLIYGFLERAGDDLFNSCVLLDPTGAILAKYSKVHPMRGRL